MERRDLLSSRNILSEIHNDFATRRDLRLKRMKETAAPIPFLAARESVTVTPHVEHIALPVAEPKKIEGKFRRAVMCVPPEISECCGINVFGRVIRSFIFSTDVVTIRNCNADAVLAVYPFTCQPAITQALIMAAECPVFTGIAGSVTHGQRSVDLAHFTEMQGATGVVLNSTVEPDTIRAVAAYVDIPVVVTVTNFDEYVQVRIASGAQIVNVAAGRNTAEVVAQVRRAFPMIPIMASGGKSGDTIRSTIAAGADAITWT
ncbi:MAG: dioxygenase, partial [Eggerthellaceae bacterium]|nr:dioxygenase [Eggerthellaceae bacterium]